MTVLESLWFDWGLAVVLCVFVVGVFVSSISRWH